jgi:predicted permease
VFAVVEIVFPVFAVVLTGYAVARAGIIRDSGVQGIADFVFFLAIPALMFRSVVQGVDLNVVNPGILIAYFGAAGAVFAIAVLWGRHRLGLGLGELAVLGLGSTFGNTVQLGIPLILQTFGPPGLLAVLFIIAFNAMILISSATLLVEVDRGRGEDRRAVVAAAAKQMAKNPIVLSMMAGLGCAAAGVKLSGPVDAFVQLLGQAGLPCALFSLGAQLVAFRVQAFGGAGLAMAVLKLGVHPALAWLLAAHVLQLNPLWTAVVTVTAAMPCGVNAFIFANRYRVLVAETASAVIVSTIVSVATLSLLVALYLPS